MTTSFNDIQSFSRFNLSERESDIHIFVREYKERIQKQLSRDTDATRACFVSFAEKRLSITDIAWLQDNDERFIRDTANDTVVRQDYLAQCGFICCMVYAEDGNSVIVGHSSGLIQEGTSYEINTQSSRPGENMAGNKIIEDYVNSINNYYKYEQQPTIWYPMFYEGKSKKPDQPPWLQENYDRFMKGTQNEVAYYRWFFSEMGAITALEYSPNGAHIIVGHSSGLIQMRHGSTGVVLHTLRNIHFPPKPIYALEYSKTEERICYAACMDGAVYRIEVPLIIAPVEKPPPFCIRADPALECLHMQFFGNPGIAANATPFVTQRSAALSLGLTADESKMVVGYADTSIKIYDMETQEALLTYKVHKLRLQFIPKKLQRMHFGQVCAMRCHNERPYMFASAAWDKTLRIWDTRCKVGCVMTFEGVDVCSDSIDLNRDHCLAGSWQTTEALTVWDLVARNKINVIRAQNRRPDVDGEYIYAAKYWHSTDYNRKGKYAIIGGSGTNCVEVINLHNRYIACSYPATGTILAVASYQDRIAYGGSAATFNIAKFYDPKHEKKMYEKEVEEDFDYVNAVSVFDDSDDEELHSETRSHMLAPQSKSVTVNPSTKIL